MSIRYDIWIIVNPVWLSNCLAPTLCTVPHLLVSGQSINPCSSKYCSAMSKHFQWFHLFWSNHFWSNHFCTVRHPNHPTLCFSIVRSLCLPLLQNKMLFNFKIRYSFTWYSNIGYLNAHRTLSRWKLPSRLVLAKLKSEHPSGWQSNQVQADPMRR